jgi:nucleotide-binding universal stress UspA family protein
MTSKQTLRRSFRLVSLLCPVDFSEPSAMALRFAAAIANRFHAGLHVLYVNDPMLVAAAAFALNNPSLVNTSLDELRAFVASALPPSVGATPVSCHVSSGDPAKLIGSTARRLKCDLVVMGTHGLSGVDRLVVGSTTERVLRRTALPVLAVPPGALEAGDSSGPPPSWPGPTIMVPVDLGDAARKDVRDAEKIARALGTRLMLVHIVSQLLTPPWLRADLSATSRIRVAKARRQLESLARAVGSGVTTEARVLIGNPSDEIAALAAEKDIGLVVMHSRKGPGFFGSRAGSIAANVLRRAVTPVLALPARTRS